jgi:nucleotide-binding universal stress UspA family protein
VKKEMKMFKHILLPTDGSKLSEAAIQQGIRFAKSIGAQVTGLCVMPLQQTFFYETEIPGDLVLELATQPSRELAETYLTAIEKGAKEAGVACDVVYEKNDNPYEAIIRVAEQKGCDLIMMASHGRRGVGALLIGSETQKVLTHSKIPVLVHRMESHGGRRGQGLLIGRETLHVFAPSKIPVLVYR